MKDEIIKYETAILAKEKGFDIPTKLCYSDSDKYALPFNGGNDYHTNSKHPYYSAPTQSLLQRWLREVHKLHLSVMEWDEEEKWTVNAHWLPDDYSFDNVFDTYEQALEAGLLEALKLIKNA